MIRGFDHNYQFPKITFVEEGQQSPALDPFSRYRRLRQVSYDGVRTLETFYPPVFNPDNGDLSRDVYAQHHHRIDLLTYDTYRATDSVWWVVAVANNMADVFRDTIPGRSLRLPPFQRIAERLVS